MARLDTIGFEKNTATELDRIVGIGQSIVSTTKRSGSYAFKTLNPLNNIITVAEKAFAVSAGTGPYFFRFYLRIHTLPGAATNIAYLHSASLAAYNTVPVVSIQLSSTGTLTLKDGSTTVGSASSALSLDTWYRIEMRLDGTPASGSRILEAKIDGVTFASTTTSTSALTAIVWGVGMNLGLSASTSTGELYFDDIAINVNNSSGHQDSYPGEGKVVYLVPAGAGDADFANPFINNDGTAIYPFGYTKVNETPPDVGIFLMRDEVAGSASRGDLFTFSSPVAAGINSVFTVSLLQINIVGGAGSNSANNARNLIQRLKSKPGGATLDASISSKFNFNTSNGWVFNNLSSPHIPNLTSYTMPGVGGAWVVTGTDSLTNMQAGYRSESTSNVGNGARVTTLWVTVEYTETPITLIGSQVIELDIAIAGETSTGAIFGHHVIDIQTPNRGTTSVGPVLGSQVLEFDFVRGQPGYQLISAEAHFTSPRTAHYRLTSLSISAYKANPTDVGDIMFSLRNGGTIVNTSAWIPLTNSPTTLSIPITGPISDPNDLRLYLEARALSDESAQPIVDTAQLFVEYWAVETDGARSGSIGAVLVVADSGFFEFM